VKIIMTIADAKNFAAARFEKLDGRHGDPLRNCSWIAERRLAEIVIHLCSCITVLCMPMEIEK
jgi:hypothetical protein